MLPVASCNDSIKSPSLDPGVVKNVMIEEHELHGFQTSFGPYVLWALWLDCPWCVYAVYLLWGLAA
jgi:hypothetical protein